MLLKAESLQQAVQKIVIDHARRTRAYKISAEKDRIRRRANLVRQVRCGCCSLCRQSDSVILL